MRRDWQVVSVVAFLVVALTGCSSGGTNDGDNCAANPGKCACSSDSACADPTPRCDTRSGRCVACLPTADNCGPAAHCIFTEGGFMCVPKDSCGSGDDCAPIGGKPALCCSGKCTDRYNDPNHCGACGTTCDAVPNANSGCVNGTCGVSSCKAGFGDCDGKPANGCESDVTGDINHCGACDTPCRKPPNSTVAGSAGKSASECVMNFADCDGNAMNGCETSTDTNAMNCGACGKACPALPNAATVACSAGTCIVETCKPNFADCNKN